MIKLKYLKKLFAFVLIFIFIVSLVPIKTFNAIATESDNTLVNTTTEDSTGDDLLGDTLDDDSDVITEDLDESAMVHFTMRVRWGNVIEESLDIEEENFDGEISVSGNARVSLERTLLFEKHSNIADDIISKKNPVLWKSLIYSHWDGVLVTVSSPSNENVTISAGNESITKSAKEFYDSSEPIIVDEDEDGKEIVIKTYPASKHPSIFLKVFWGKIDKTSYNEKRCVEGLENSTIKCWLPLLNADGSLSINNSGKLKLIKPLRFEWPDKILSKSESQIDWRSRLYGGVDGVLVKLKLNANELDSSDELTVSFDNHGDNFPKSYSILDLYHNRYTEYIIDEGYGVAFQVWRRPNRSIIRIKNKPTVYVVEDGVKQPIPSEEVLASQGMTFDDVELVDQDEADTYSDGDPINYIDGTIVQEEGTPEVYVIENGEKKHIKDPNSFVGLGYSWNNIVKVKRDVLGLFRKGVDLKANSIHPEGALIRVAGNSKVYVIEGGRRVPISDIQLFNARRYDWGKVLIVNENQAKKFAIGESLVYPDGSLLRAGNGNVYRINQGRKQWVRSADDFRKAGYKAEKVLNVDDSILESFKDGLDIVADDIVE